MHLAVEPSILYFGTPVVLISTVNEDGTTNVAPMSSAWWLGWNCMLGLGGMAHTGVNLRRERECVLNLPSVSEVGAVNRLAKLTGADPVPEWKQSVGYRHEKDKCGVAGLTCSESELVRAQRVDQCPIQLEAVLERCHEFGHRPDKAPGAIAYEVRIVRAHVNPSVLGRAREPYRSGQVAAAHDEFLPVLWAERRGTRVDAGGNFGGDVQASCADVAVSWRQVNSGRGARRGR